MAETSRGLWRYYRLTVAVAGLLILAHIVAAAAVKKAEIDKLWLEEDPPEVMEWAQL